MNTDPSSKSDEPRATEENLNHSAVKATQVVDSQLTDKQVRPVIIKKLNLRTELDSLISRARKDKDNRDKNFEQDKEELLKHIALINGQYESALRRRSRALASTLRATKMLLSENFNALLAEIPDPQTCVSAGGKWCEEGPCGDGDWCSARCCDPESPC